MQKTYKFGNPQLYFEQKFKDKNHNQNNAMLVTTKFPEADVIYASAPVTTNEEKKLKKTV